MARKHVFHGVGPVWPLDLHTVRECAYMYLFNVAPCCTGSSRKDQGRGCRPSLMQPGGVLVPVILGMIKPLCGHRDGVVDKEGSRVGNLQRVRSHPQSGCLITHCVIHSLSSIHQHPSPAFHAAPPVYVPRAAPPVYVPRACMPQLHALQLCTTALVSGRGHLI